MGNPASREIFGNKTGPNTGTGLDTLAKNQGAMREGVGMLPPKDVTILDGAISGFEEAALIVDTEGGGAADDLVIISPVISATENLHPGMLITLRAKDPARVVTVKNSVSPNGINTADGNDIVLSPNWELPLRLVGGRWYEVRGRSSALAAEAQEAADDALAAAILAQSTADTAKTITDTVTPTPTANGVPQANADGKIPDWAFETGDLVPSFAASKTGFFLCNGGAYSRTTYAKLFAVIGTAFGVGDGSTTFNVPDFRGRTLQGANANLMAVLAAGLPDVEGIFGLYGGSSSHSGPFSQGGTATVLGGGAPITGPSVKMQLSKGNPIFGASTTVQTPAIAANVFIKF